MSRNLKTEAVDFLFDAVLALENREECYRFFEDVCTVNELQALSQRFEVAHMLRNSRTYMDIAETTGASTATISRVNRSLNYGHDGYDMVLKRLAIRFLFILLFLFASFRFFLIFPAFFFGLSRQPCVNNFFN